MCSFAEYGLPVDERELDRQDMQHRKYTMLQQNRLYLAPLKPDIQKILDLGTGTGSSWIPIATFAGAMDVGRPFSYVFLSGI